MTDIKSKSHLDALKSARMFIAFIGAIIFMIFTYYEIPVNDNKQSGRGGSDKNNRRRSLCGYGNRVLIRNKN